MVTYPPTACPQTSNTNSTALISCKCGRKPPRSFCMGRTLSDVPALPSLPRASSQLDHALFSPSLFPLNHCCSIQPLCRNSHHLPCPHPPHPLHSPGISHLSPVHNSNPPLHLQVGPQQAQCFELCLAVPNVCDMPTASATRCRCKLCTTSKHTPPLSSHDCGQTHQAPQVLTNNCIPINLCTCALWI